jgi:hypothetical protein
MLISLLFSLRPAIRENVPVLIGLAGGTGSGKTYSAMRLAKGLSGGQRFAVIDTESGRAKAYADEFDFDSGELMAPFTAEKYIEAIETVDAQHKYSVIIVDSASHEYAGEGGLLDQQEEELERMAKDDFAKREACKMASWIKPKKEHKRFINTLLQVRSHIILCFRAEPKIEMVRGKDGKMVIEAKKGLTGLDGWFPITERNMPFEMTDYLLLTADKAGVPHPIKLMERHKAFFPLDQPITEEAGVKLAAWAKGAAAEKKTPVTDPGIEEDFFPICQKCDDAGQGPTRMLFVASGRTKGNREYEAFWICRKHQPAYTIRHVDHLAHVAEVKRIAESMPE